MGRQDWPVVGRERELAAVHAALAGRAGARGVLLTGEAGVGKTTLARSAIRSAPGPVHWVAGSEAACDVPLGVFAHLLNAPMPGDPLTMLADAFETVRRERFSLIAVDDAHLVDHLSATLLHQLAVEGVVRIVATARSPAPIPETITTLWKDGYLSRVEVGAFGRAEAVRLIETALGGRCEQLSADLMWEASGGNPLFVRHLIEGALEAGRLCPVNGVWQLRGRTAVTSKFSSLLGGRLDLLPEDERRPLHLLAFAEPLPLEIMSELVDQEVLERVERRGLIRIADDTGSVEVYFTHALIGDVIRQGLGALAGRRLRAELLTAMAGHPARTAAERLRRAELAVDAEAPVDPAVLVRAAEDAIALTNIGAAERMARAAAARGGGPVAAELLARSLLWQGRESESEEILRSIDPDTLTEFEFARWGIARVANLQWSIGDPDAAAEVLEMLRERITHPRARLVVDGLASALLLRDSRLEEADALARRVLDDPAAPPTAVGWAVFGGVMGAALAGRTGDAAELARRGQEVTDRIDALLRFLLAFGEVRALTMAGDFAAAEARSGDIVRITCPGQFRARAMANVLAGTVDFGRGRLDTAAARLEETLAALSGETAALWNLPARLLLAQCYCGLGRVDAAATLVAELRAHVGRGGSMFEAPVRTAEAWLAAAEGHLSGAVEIAVEAADLAARSGQRAVELLALHAAARFGDEACLPRLIEVARLIGGPLAEADATHAAGLLEHDGAQVYSAAQQFERVGTMLSAADAAAQAAALFEAAGRRRDALEASATADRLARACGGLKTPALRAACKPLPLSRREREIAELVARGLTNRDIAERLVVSTRTVEGHLYRIYLKLNVTDRSDLAALISG